MTDIVYTLGAGVNQAIKGENVEISLPLLKDFFKVAFKIKPDLTAYENELKPVYEYIKKYWNRDIIDLQNDDFDLEECFTLIQYQLEEENTNKEIDEKTYDSLLVVFLTLTALLIEILNEFKNILINTTSSQYFLNFGKFLETTTYNHQF